MTAVMWMAACCAATSAAIVALVPAAVRVEWMCGMIGPFAAVAVSWLVIDRASRRGAAGVSAVLLKAFAVKFLFFGLYVAVMIRGVGLQPVPFVTSFALYFIALYAAEAWLLQRLSSGLVQMPEGVR